MKGRSFPFVSKVFFFSFVASRVLLMMYFIEASFFPDNKYDVSRFMDTRPLYSSLVRLSCAKFIADLSPRFAMGVRMLTIIIDPPSVESSSPACGRSP